jgi:predicted MPP superfamily phosphohydrolase
MDFCESQPRPSTERALASRRGIDWAAGWRWLEFFPPRNIEWGNVQLSIPSLPAALEGLRIVHLSDLHLRTRWPAAYDGMLARIRQNPPDLLLFTGDFVDDKNNHRPAMPLVRKMVDGWAAGVGRFAIHGNHDSYAIGAELAPTGVQFMDGRRAIAQTPRGGRVELIGLPGRRRHELSRAFLARMPAKEPGTLRIVLSHFPDHLRRTGALDADLFLAGHTHGGQVCLPTGRPILTHDTLPAPWATGIHRVGQTWLVVSRGLGTTGLPVRAFCAPQVVEMTLARVGLRSED